MIIIRTKQEAASLKYLLKLKMYLIFLWQRHYVLPLIDTSQRNVTVHIPSLFESEYLPEGKRLEAVKKGNNLSLMRDLKLKSFPRLIRQQQLFPNRKSYGKIRSSRLLLNLTWVVADTHLMPVTAGLLQQSLKEESNVLRCVWMGGKHKNGSKQNMQTSNNCTLQEKQTLEKIQFEAARIVTGATKLVSFQALYNEKVGSLRNSHKETKINTFL